MPSVFRRTMFTFVLLAAPAVAQTADVITEINGFIRPVRQLPPVARAGDKSLPSLRKPIPAEQVQPLIEALGSKDYKTREKASKDLLAADDRVLPHLEEAMNTTDSPEVQRRLEVIVERMKQNRALRASRVSVHARGLSAKTVLKDICRQAGYTLTGEVGDAAKVTLDLDDVPFWEAVEKVCDPLGLTLDPNGGGEERAALNVYAADTTNPFTSVSGPFKFVATNISSSKNIQLSGLPRRGGGNPANEYINMNAQVFAEPKLPIVAVGPARLTKAVDDKGESLTDPSDGQPTSAPLTNAGYYRTFSQSLSFNLARGHKDATTAKEVRGVVPMLLLVDVKAELEIDDILTVKKKKFTARSCDLEVVEVTEANGVVSAKVVFTPRTQPDDGDNYSWWSTLPQRVVLADDKGVRFVNAGATEEQQSPAAVTCTLQFTPPADRKKMKPATLMLTYWVTVQQDVEFVFKNVPLP